MLDNNSVEGSPITLNLAREITKQCMISNENSLIDKLVDIGVSALFIQHLVIPQQSTTLGLVTCNLKLHIVINN